MTIAYQHLELPIKKPLVVGVSGGPDSVCLLHLLRETGFQKIIVAHVDHQIRKTSGKDALFVKKMVRKYRLPFHLLKKNIPRLAKQQKENVEALGRTVRYEFFRELQKKYKASAIVTAHHADDQIETVLLNITRGAGLQGITGMKEMDHGIWRPFIPYSKKQILQYCKTKKLSFLREPTPLRYQRNFLRLKVIPLLKKINPNLTQTMRKNISLWQDAVSFLEDYSSSFLKSHLQKRSRRLIDLQGLPRFHQSLVLRAWYEKIHGTTKSLSSAHLSEVLEIVNANISNKKKEFGPRTLIVKEKNALVLEQRR